MGPGRELSQWPCMKMRRPQKGHSQHQAWSNTGPLLPPLQAYQEMHSLGPPTVIPGHQTAGVTARAQGTSRPGCPRTIWVQPRTGPRAREKTLGTFWEPSPSPGP